MTAKGFAELIKVRSGLMRKETHGTTAFCKIKDFNKELDTVIVRAAIFDPKEVLEHKFEITIRKIPFPTLVGEGEWYND